MYMSGATVPENLGDQINLMAAYATAPGYRGEAKTRYDNYIQSFYPTLDSTPLKSALLVMLMLSKS